MEIVERDEAGVVTATYITSAGTWDGEKSRDESRGEGCERVDVIVRIHLRSATSNPSRFIRLHCY